MGSRDSTNSLDPECYGLVRLLHNLEVKDREPTPIQISVGRVMIDSELQTRVDRNVKPGRTTKAELLHEFLTRRELDRNDGLKAIVARVKHGLP